MPFAIVGGEPVSQLPTDLYIPPYALEVFLEAFEGPLDLLLYLIRRQNLDILDIPIAEITLQYVEYIDLMEEIQFELAAEYLLMAAILAEIKSRMLLPRPKIEESEEGDPRAELVRRLQEYERYKNAAEDLDQLPRLERNIHVANAFVVNRSTINLPPDVDLKEMLLALRDVLHRADLLASHAITSEPLSVRERMSIVLEKLLENPFTEFHLLFTVEEGRTGVVVTFLALLELLKERLIDVIQNEPLGRIYVKTAEG